MVAARRNGAPLRVARGGAVSPIVTADELRERIEAALRERRATDTIGVGVRPVGASPHTPRSWLAHASIVSLRDGREDASWRCYAATEDDALMELAVAVGLNPDGTDPRAEIATLRQRVDILNARDEVGIEERDRLRREREEASAEVERAEPRRQRDARDIADADAEVERLRAVLAVTQASLAAASRGERVTVADEVDRLQRENARLRDAAREFLDARAAYDVANAYDATNADDERRAWERRAAAQSALAALVGGSK